jgi:nucleotide-binding universal stress UspA family protein
MLPLKKILCPTDFSAPSYTALDKAVELAQHFDAELWLIHVVPFLPVTAPDLVVVASVPSDADRMETARQELNSAVTRVPAGVKVHTEVRMGYADKEIVCAAHDEGFDLIVIATFGHTGWRHLVFGSVAEAVVRQSRCPVLTVHAQTPQESQQAS